MTSTASAADRRRSKPTGQLDRVVIRSAALTEAIIGPDPWTMV